MHERTLPALTALLSTLLFTFSGCQALQKDAEPPPAVVFQTDFGLKDGAVAGMKGVALGVSPRLRLEDLTHAIPAYDIWQAAYRLDQTIDYWPEGTVFVSVVDPGVGTARRSVVARTGSGHYVVTPDNGTLTLIADRLGIDGLRSIDEATNRREGSRASHTFHGRDVYAYTAARLASGEITYAQVGGELAPGSIIRLKYQRATSSGGALRGAIPVLDVQYGNVWTNIGEELWEELQLRPGERVKVAIRHERKVVWEGVVPYANTFGDVAKGAPLCYLNSLGNVALALNMGNFAEAHGIGCGADWQIELRRLTPLPKKAGPKKGDPKKAGPKKADPKKAGPQKADPKEAGPKRADPKEADPKQPGEPKRAK